MWKICLLWIKAKIQKAEKDQLTQSLAGQVEGQAMGGLRKKAAVVDNRMLSQLGVRL